VGKLFIFFIIILLVLLLVAAYALADSTSTIFSTTTQFDLGTKNNVETVSNICNLQSASNQFGLAGVGGYVGVRGTCTSGTKDFSNSMQSSYNFETLDTGKLNDFIGTADCTINNSPTSVNALYSFGYQFASGSSQYMNCPGGSPATQDWSVSFIFKPTVSGAKVILSLDTSSGNFAIRYGETCGLAADSGVLHACQTNTNDASATVSINNFHYVAWVKNSGNSTHNLYVDGVWKAKATSVNGGTTDFNVCQLRSGFPEYCDAIVDELTIWNRILTNAEILDLATDGRNLFSSSGNWISAIQPFTSGKTTFDSVSVQWTPGASTSRFVNGILIKDGSGNLIGLNTTQIKSGTSATYIFGTSQTADVIQWTIQLNLTGDGSGTINVYSITINFTFNNQVTLFANYGWVFGFLGMLILGLIGSYWIKTKREERG